MKQKHFNIIIEVLFLALLFLAAVIFDRRIGIVFSLTKATTIRFFTIIIFSVWAIKILIFRENKFVRSVLDWPVLTYLLACTVATITAVHVYISLFGFYGRFEGLITLYNFGLIFFVATNYITDLKAVRRLVATVFSAGVIMAIYAIIQRKGIDPYAWGGVVTWQRVIATIGQPNFYAAYADMSFLLTFALFLFPKREKGTEGGSFLPFLYFFIPVLAFLFMIYPLGQMINPLGPVGVFFWYLGFGICAFGAILFAYKFDDMDPLLSDILLGAGLILIYTALFYTQSRGGFLGFFAALSLFFFVCPRKIIIQNWQKLGILFIALAMVTGITIADPQFSLFSRMASEIKVESSEIEFEGAAGSRGETWKSAFRIIADYPLFGIGPEVLKMVFPRYETDLFRFKEAFHVKQDRCHNETLDVPVTRGLVSFFAYLLVLGLVFRHGFKQLSSFSPQKGLIFAAFIAAITAYLIQNQFSFGVVAITSLFWVMWAVVVKVKELPDERVDKKDDKRADVDYIPLIPIAIIVLVSIFLIYLSSIPFRADKAFKMGKTLSQGRNFKPAIGSFEASLNIQPFEGGPITHKGISLINYAAALKLEKDKAPLYKEAIEILSYGTKVDPYNADNFYILSRIYLMQNKLEQSEQMAAYALKIDPYYAEVYIIMAHLAQKDNNSDRAITFYKEAYRLNPNIIEAKIKVIWDLVNLGDYGKAFVMVQEIIMENPKFIEGYNVLGTIYFKNGERKKAREEFETVLSLDPNNSYAKRMLGR
ncbi:MAG: O-antigen ligase family protein [Candidatus Saganbacteria bacterium]|nr:O-antigen ligase family protein [Candidatus Saganbacteria bacterium]